MMRNTVVFVLVMSVLVGTGIVQAQGGGESAAIPTSVRLEGFRYEYQGWNNCGPATLTIALSHFGWEPDQFTAAQWLKPDPEDKNVSAWQMAAFVNEFTGVKALVRYGGDLQRLRELVALDFPVIIAAGFEPDGYDWMGHYLLLIGYDSVAGTMLTHDSFLGPETVYPQEEIDYYWQHFNRVYIVLYPPAREAELLGLLGDDADVQRNALHALEVARSEAAESPESPFAWFNLGTSFTLLEMYEEASVAFDQARNVGGGLPWRMLWYQFGIFEAYLNTGRYEDVIALAHYNLSTTPEGEHPIEETYYYAGRAREGQGESERAIVNYQQAVLINPNFTPAVIALDALASGS